MARLVQLSVEGKLHSTIDDGSGHSSGPFYGLESIQSAVEVGIRLLD